MMASNFSEPTWASGAPPPAPEPIAPAPVVGGTNSVARSTEPNKCLQRCLSILCVGCSIGMASLGILGVLDMVNELELGNISQLFVSVYLVIFALILFLYELMWWTNIDKVNHHIRKNFGFLYRISGKGAYLIFVAFLTIGLSDDVKIRGIRYVVGGAFLATGVLLLFLGCTNSELVGSYKTPTSGFNSDINSPV